MSYVDAGYAIGLGVLFVYAVSLLLRRRRLERMVDAATRQVPPLQPPPDDRAEP
jgi:hypothetical protein